MIPDRRDFLRRAGLAAAAGATLTACGQRAPEGAAGPSAAAQRFEWKMVTSWPPNFPGLGAAAARLGERITAASGGRLTVKVFGGGELVPPFEVFDAVSRGTAEMGHASNCGASCTRSSTWCRSRPATPACRWPAGSTARSRAWPT